MGGHLSAEALDLSPRQPPPLTEEGRRVPVRGVRPDSNDPRGSGSHADRDALRDLRMCAIGEALGEIVGADLLINAALCGVIEGVDGPSLWS